MDGSRRQGRRGTQNCAGTEREAGFAAGRGRLSPPASCSASRSFFLILLATGQSHSSAPLRSPLLPSVHFLLLPPRQSRATTPLTRLPFVLPRPILAHHIQHPAASICVLLLPVCLLARIWETGRERIYSTLNWILPELRILLVRWSLPSTVISGSLPPTEACFIGNHPAAAITTRTMSEFVRTDGAPIPVGTAGKPLSKESFVLSITLAMVAISVVSFCLARRATGIAAIKNLPFARWCMSFLPPLACRLGLVLTNTYSNISCLHR